MQVTKYRKNRMGTKLAMITKIMQIQSRKMIRTQKQSDPYHNCYEGKQRGIH